MQRAVGIVSTIATIIGFWWIIVTVFLLKILYSLINIYFIFYIYIYIYIYIIFIYMVFTSEGSFEVAIESWPEWNLNP